VLAAAITIAADAPHTAAAQALAGSVEIGYSFGRYLGGSFAPGSTRAFADRIDVDDNQQTGLWLGAQIDPRWGIEVAFRRAKTDIVGTQGGVFAHKPRLAGLDASSFEVLALHSFPRGHFVPYVGGGLSAVNLDIDLPDAAYRDANRLGVAVAGGARFYFTRWLGMRAEARARATYLGPRGEADRGWHDGGRWYTSTEITTGIFFSFTGLLPAGSH
jgi:hypothetical protein